MSAVYSTDLDCFVFSPTLLLRDLIIRLEQLDSDIALVGAVGGNLEGVITDGDIRRALLRKVDLLTPISEFMSRSPTTAPAGLSQTEYIARLKGASIRHLPILDVHGHLVDMAILERMTVYEPTASIAVIMAGGLGTRLGELTRSTPKPLLKIGDEPIISRILKSLQRHGIREAYLCVNHLADQIEEFVGDGSQWGLKIHYVREPRRMGTAGALSLLPRSEIRAPLLVMNADLVTLVRFVNLMNFHQVYNHDVTVCVSQYDIQIPYGVIETDGPLVKAIREKPVQNFFINAGIYVLNPAVLDLIPPNEPMDMPAVINKSLERNLRVGCFPMREFWIDVGTPAEFQRANREISR